MGDVEALQKEVQRVLTEMGGVITEMNDRLLKAEGEINAAHHVIDMLARCLVITNVIDRDEWNNHIKGLAEISAADTDEKDIPTRKFLGATSSAFHTYSITDASPDGFRPVVIKGGKQPD